MSVRAYKVLKMELADNPSFNLWHDEKIVDFLNENDDFNSQMNDNGGGYITVSVKSIRKILANLEEFELDELDIEQLRKDIEGLEDGNYITYSCF